MILSLDLGTSGCKAIAVRRDGRIEAETTRAYGQKFDAGEWRKAIKSALSCLVKNTDSQVDAITVTGLGGAFFTLDENRDPASKPFPAYMSSREDEFPEDISDLEGSHWMMYRNLLWLRENRPEKFRNSEKVLDARDYAGYVLTGKVRRNDFGFPQQEIEELNNRFDISDSIFPETTSFRQPLGTLSEDLAENLGVGPVPVFVCPWDEICGAIGAGAVEEGNAYCMAGTTCIAGVCTSEGNRSYPLENLELHSEYSSIGKVHRKILEESGLRNFGQLDVQAQKVERDVLQPGEELDRRLEKLDSAAKKARTVYEADARHIKQALEKSGVEGVDKIVVGGGGSESSFWNSMRAEIAGREMVKVQTEKLAALGAAVMAASSLGIYSNLETAAEEMVEN